MKPDTESIQADRNDELDRLPPDNRVSVIDAQNQSVPPTTLADLSTSSDVHQPQFTSPKHVHLMRFIGVASISALFLIAGGFWVSGVLRHSSKDAVSLASSKSVQQI
jgi:hypothetical protein